MPPETLSHAEPAVSPFPENYFLDNFALRTDKSALINTVASFPANYFLENLESVREHQTGLQSFRSMRRIDARRKKASALRFKFSQSFASRRQRLSHAIVRSTIQRRGSTTNPLA